MLLPFLATDFVYIKLSTLLNYLTTAYTYWFTTSGME